MLTFLLPANDQAAIVLTCPALAQSGAVRAAVERYCERFECAASTGDYASSVRWTYSLGNELSFVVAFASDAMSLTTEERSIANRLVRAIFDDLVVVVLAMLSRTPNGGEEVTVVFYSAGKESGAYTITLPADTRQIILDFGSSEFSDVRAVGDDRSELQRTTADPTGRMIFADHAERPDDSKGDTVRIFYATDRAPETIDGVATFGGGRGLLSYGYCDVDLPRARQIGEIQPPLLRRMFIKIIPAARLVVGAPIATDGERFYALLSDRIAMSPRKRAFVFVHGYNVTFDVAVGRAAQLHADLGFDGATVAYSWPSRGKMSAYFMDAAAVEAGRHRLARLLREIVAGTGATEVHILAHSMGNRAVARALEQLAPELMGHSPVQQLLLAAPDVDAVEMENMLPSLKQIARRITVYGSSKDKPLALSELLTGWRRAGDGGESLLRAPDYADCIDASEIDTAYLSHSYAMDNAALLADIKALIDDDKPPNSRFGLVGPTNGAWTFRGRRYE